MDATIIADEDPNTTLEENPSLGFANGTATTSPTTPTSLPNRKSIQDCLRLDQHDVAILEPNQEAVQNLDQLSSTYDKASHNYLLQSKFNQLNNKFKAKDVRLKESINSGTENIKKTFNDIKNTVGGFSDMFEYKIDWEFWTRIVNDYESVIKNESDELDKLIMSGIPKEFRGIIWQLVAKSKNFQLEEFYIQLKSETSVHEKSIKRDLSRTSFFTNVEQVNKGEELFNVIKAYSLFDPDVGYTQGMIFITIPLIMNMSDAECFCLLVTLMKDYKLRDLFSPEMKGLHLFLYEFDRLLESYSPILYNHLVKQGIKSSMYASQWFLTFFAYKFPLDIVLRIYDIIITQGIESILKFAVNLMIKNESNLLALKFDKLLGFLKDKLFNIYINEEFVDFKEDASLNNSINGGLKRSSKRFSLLPGSKRNSTISSSSSGSNYYKLNELVTDSMEINVEPVELTKYENEFENIYLSETAKTEDIEKIKVENGNLRYKIKELETQYTNLNRDHIDIVQNMVDIKVKLPEVLHDNDELSSAIEHLRVDIEELESKTSDSPTVASSQDSFTTPKSPALPSSIENSIQQLLLENCQETEKFANLEEEFSNLLLEDEKLSQELKGSDNKKWFGRWGK
ncbi:RabGAP/TBC [Suhomyces tanzawaensis NRRL Y-17324]|uniref:GTPase-activating protein GYP5 n=1 Tax=Suhomyces tanzawaensis NRRL Y-17324 TaxID=984487 RepID=A0A1E4SSS6_9ASCO|nr:RabGAP/TBC [Suhomyces tanzawaensis NRRL Y-17324]ODV82477.1 RabGAP/TBC [Suhomyces tanzawaensis NRRL Y-17324]